MGKLKSDLLVKCGVVISFTDLLASSELLSLQNSGYTSLFYKKISFQWAYLQSQNDSLALCSTPVVLIAETYPPYFYSCFHVSLDPIVNLRWRFNSGGYCAWLIFLVAGVKGMNFLYGSFWDYVSKGTLPNALTCNLLAERLLSTLFYWFDEAWLSNCYHILWTDSLYDSMSMDEPQAAISSACCLDWVLIKKKGEV